MRHLQEPLEHDGIAQGDGSQIPAWSLFPLFANSVYLFWALESSFKVSVHRVSPYISNVTQLQ